ncbi:hypothetical protein [Deinococcus cellulosilyticus]|uniref:Outer membrane protein beta-barrel domain-containing protein n=1 Tax=Deinococcus cellulosilyticus (strain DSM 18568 / NBRC 106333 / KACC 11606 / 5516J-15) TaxID=1223518 RepID=A0A511N6A1_DEIC1|nr:hypothetical protein [Deinococcus cellulosilyticus]GEM47966.1 hypothetical protein DC3_36010 [Deinococcus cellulosilyticus NBRC 106333 = KACC 11606]
MKNIVMISILALAGSAFAAGKTYVQGSTGAEAGFVTHGQGNPWFSANLGIGAEKFLGDFDGRGEVMVDIRQGSFGMGFAADLLYPFGKSDVKPYVGFGLELGVGSGNPSVALRGNFGADFEFTRTAAIFAELQPKYTFGNFGGFDLGGRAGLKVFF